MTVQKKDVIEVARYVLVAANDMITEKPVQLSRPKFPHCEVSTPEGQNDEQIIMEALSEPSAVAKAFE